MTPPASTRPATPPPPGPGQGEAGEEEDGEVTDLEMFQTVRMTRDGQVRAALNPVTRSTVHLSPPMPLSFPDIPPAADGRSDPERFTGYWSETLWLSGYYLDLITAHAPHGWTDGRTMELTVRAGLHLPTALGQDQHPGRSVSPFRSVNEERALRGLPALPFPEADIPVGQLITHLSPRPDPGGVTE